MTIVSAQPLLQVDKLSIRFPGMRGGESLLVVDKLSYALWGGKTLAIVGESGSGKTVSCRSLMGLLSSKFEVTGSIRLAGKELVGASQDEMRRHRGADVSMVFQNPARALNPVIQIGEQIAEALRTHTSIRHDIARLRTLKLLEELELSPAEKHYHFFPHQLSGGMQQRVMIAIAIACKPKLLIADEATRSLDPSTQIQIIKLIKELQNRLNMGLIFVSHDLKLAATIADDVLVMKSGKAVDYGTSAQVFRAPAASYTKDLLRATTQRSYSISEALPRSDPLLIAKNLFYHFSVKEPFSWTWNRIQALSGLSFEVRRGETFGIVGRTGSGKSTLARALLQMPKPDTGSVVFLGDELTALQGKSLRAKRRYMQIVFQDCFESLNPKWSVFSIVEEPLRALEHLKKQEMKRKVEEVLTLVGLPASVYSSRRPGDLSGGECQRVAIARALVANPKLLILDEAFSALDVLIQRQLLDLLHEIREKAKLSLIFISHNLEQVQRFCHRVAVMHAGQLCELVPSEKLYSNCRHPYTNLLISSAPMDGQLSATNRSGAFTKRESSSLLNLQAGCRFYARCPNAQMRCLSEVPALRYVDHDHEIACHFPIHVRDSSAVT